MSHAFTKRELREQRRAARQAAERAARAREIRRRRLWQLGAVAGIAVVVVAAVIALSSSGGSTPTRSPSEAAALFRGIPERNGVLGANTAPITVTEFLDPQCPVCAEASRSILPTLVNDYIRTGKVKLDAQPLHFIGPDSVRAARFAEGAARQNRFWPFMEAFYAAQKQENSGYVTDSFLRSVAASAGVNATKALAYANSAQSQRPLDQANAQAARLGVNATPTFTIARGKGSPKVVSASDLLAQLRG